MESPDKLVLAAHIIKHLYEDLDLLEDDAVVEWWEGLGASKNQDHQVWSLTQLYSGRLFTIKSQC